MLKKTSFIFSLLCLIVLSIQAQGLKFHDGQFKIVQFTDLHYQPANPASQQAIDCIKENDTLGFLKLFDFKLNKDVEDKESVKKNLLSEFKIANSFFKEKDIEFLKYDNLDALANAEIIYNKRGIGVFVAEDGVKKIKALRKRKFLEKDLPLVFKNMYVLGIDLKEIQENYEKFQPEKYLKEQNTDHEKE